MDCPRKYFYSQVRGLRRKRRAATLTFGSAFHKALETYELQKPIIGGEAAVRVALEAAQAEAVGMEEHKSRTPEALVRSIGAYIAHHEREQLETITTAEGAPAVELHFTTPMASGLKHIPQVVYCGYIDRIVRFQGVPYIMDHKTTGQAISTEKGSASYFASFTPDNQFSGYTYAAKAVWNFPVRGVIVDAMQVLKTRTEFARGVIHRTENQIDEWRDGAVQHIELASECGARAASEKTVLDQARHYPMNPRACHARFGACTFASICGRDPSVREAFLETEFAVEPWNPLQPRQSGTLEGDVGETTGDDT